MLHSNTLSVGILFLWQAILIRDIEVERRITVTQTYPVAIIDCVLTIQVIVATIYRKPMNCVGNCICEL